MWTGRAEVSEPGTGAGRAVFGAARAAVGGGVTPTGRKALTRARFLSLGAVRGPEAPVAEPLMASTIAGRADIGPSPC